MSGNIALQTTTVSVREFAGVAQVPISRTGDLSQAVTVEYLVSAQSATITDDFVGGDGTVTIPAGADSAIIEVPIIDDSIGEDTETLQVSLVRATSGTLLAPRTAIVSILDDETPVVEPTAPPLISAYDVTDETVLSDLDQPISVEFTADGSRVYVAEKGGVIKLFDVATGEQISTVLDISDKVNEAGDRGLVDIAIAPDFETSKEIWVVYVVDPPETEGQTGPAGPDGIGNRYVYLSKFQMTDDGLTAIPESETVLIGGAGQSLADIAGEGALDYTAAEFADEVSSAVDPNDPTGFKQDYWKVDAQSHMGGSIEFGPDGALYVTTGDGGSYNIPDRRNIEVQSIDSLTGKVLRIDPDTGLGLPDNPFAIDDLDANRSKVLSLGQRNPYTLAIDDAGRVITADTGWGQAEEINIGPDGANFGWPFYEGGDGENWVTPGYDRYPEQAGFFAAEEAGEFTVTPAFKGFSRSASDPGYQVQAIVGADGVHMGDIYPASLDDHYIFTDVARTNVFMLNLNDQTDVKYLFTTEGLIGPVYFEPAPDGTLYYVDLVAGTVNKIGITEADTPAALNGSATYDADDASYRLTGSVAGFYPGTSGSRFQAGSANALQTVALDADFTVTAELYFGDDDGGGDGMAFVLHGGDETALGSNGGSLGATGIENGLAVKFDTFSGPGEPASDYVQLVLTDGTPIGDPVNVANLEDDAWHDAVFSWDASEQRLTVTLDGTVLISEIVDLEGIVGADAGRIGFTAATGGVTNEHKVRDIAVSTPSAAPTGIPVDTTLAGDATFDATSNTFELVDGEDSVGAAHFDGLIDLHGRFELSIAYNAGADGGDGFGIAFHGAGADGLGLSGGNVGLVGLGDENRRAIEIDLYDNGEEDGDIAADHISVFTGDDQADPILAPVALSDVEDGEWHTLDLSWDPTTDTLTIEHDGTIVGTVPGEALRAAAVPGTQVVGVSLTGATGGTTMDGLVRVTEFEADMVGPDMAELAPAGDAALTDDGVVLADGSFEAGALGTTTELDLSEDFALSFTLEGSGADGIAIVLHTDPRGPDAVGFEGGNLGADGIANLFGFEIDTFNNGDHRGDIDGPHTGVLRSADGAIVFEDAMELPASSDLSSLEVSLEWDVETELFTLYIDGVRQHEIGFDVVDAALGDSSSAFLSITGATGGLTGSWLVSDAEVFGSLIA